MSHSLLTLFSGFGSVIAVGLVGLIWRYGKALVRMEAQFRNNGGSSMRDAVDRIEETQHDERRKRRKFERKVSRELRALNARVSTLEGARSE